MHQPTHDQCKAVCALLLGVFDQLPASDRDFATSLLDRFKVHKTLSPKQYGWADYLAARVLAGGTLAVPDWLKTDKMKAAEQAMKAKHRGTHAASHPKSKTGKTFKSYKHKPMSDHKDEWSA